MRKLVFSHEALKQGEPRFVSTENEENQASNFLPGATLSFKAVGVFVTFPPLLPSSNSQPMPWPYVKLLFRSNSQAWRFSRQMSWSRGKEHDYQATRRQVGTAPYGMLQPKRTTRISHNFCSTSDTIFTTFRGIDARPTSASIGPPLGISYVVFV